MEYYTIIRMIDVELGTTIWANLTDMTLSGRNQTWKVCTVFFHSDKEQKLEDLTDAARSQVVIGPGSSTVKHTAGHKAQFWGMGEILFLNAGTGSVCKIQSPNPNIFCFVRMLYFHF